MPFASRGETMRRGLTIILAVTAGLVTAQAYGADIAKGRKLFMSVGCYACHGTVGQGAAPTGPRLAPNPQPLDVFLKELRAPRNLMPPYAASLLSDDAVSDIRAYLATISPPPESR